MIVSEGTKRAARVHAERLFALPNVNGVGYGKKIVGGEQTDIDAVMVFVVEKRPLEELAAHEIVPAVVDGVDTDVVYAGEIVAQFDPTERHRPAPPGVSIGHYRITAGTLGAWVRHKATGRMAALTNNHVGANSNDADIGDPWLQPGSHDGGAGDDILCELADFVPIVFSSGSCPIARFVAESFNWLAARLGRKARLTIQQGTNTVDCAIGFPLNEGDIELEIPVIGKLIPEPVKATVGMKVQKYGRTTQYTMGSVIALDTTISVNYGGPVAIFEQQIVVAGDGGIAFSAGGDSGSGIPDMGPRPVGLLFAGSDQVTIMNPISLVLDALDIEFV